jgi:hypothetical protein
VLKGALLLGLLAYPQACASGEACQRDPITGADRCQPASSSYAEAVGTAAAATAAFGAVGCTLNDCEPPFRCNQKTKLCERIRCGEGKGTCPPAYTCDLQQGVCK